MLLGLSGASFLFAALNNWYYYILGALFLAVGIYFQRRRQRVTGSPASQRRNRWLFPLVTVASGGVAYVLITFILVPLLTPFTRPPSQNNIISQTITMNESSETKPAPLAQTELHVDGTPYAKPASLRQAELRVEGMT